MNVASPASRRKEKPSTPKQRCRVCKCTWEEPCNPPCSWTFPDLCSTCADAAEAIAVTLTDWTEAALHGNATALIREVKFLLSLKSAVGKGVRGAKV